MKYFKPSIAEAKGSRKHFDFFICAFFGVGTNKVWVVENGTFLGELEVKDIPKFMKGDNDCFSPSNFWEDFFTTEHKTEFGLVKEQFRVYCGNIGLVEETESFDLAISVYNDYVTQSKEGYGRAAGEDVYLYSSKSDEPLKEYNELGSD